MMRYIIARMAYREIIRLCVRVSSYIWEYYLNLNRQFTPPGPVYANRLQLIFYREWDGSLQHIFFKEAEVLNASFDHII